MKRTESSRPALLRPAEVYSRLSVSDHTARRLVAEGKLVRVAIGPRSYRFTAASVETIERCGVAQ